MAKFRVLQGPFNGSTDPTTLGGGEATRTINRPDDTWKVHQELPHKETKFLPKLEQPMKHNEDPAALREIVNDWMAHSNL